MPFYVPWQLPTQGLRRQNARTIYIRWTNTSTHLESALSNSCILGHVVSSGDHFETDITFYYVSDPVFVRKSDPLHLGQASLVAQTVKNLPAMRETPVRSLGWEDSLKQGMATHSSILVWRLPMDRGAWWATVHGVTKSRTWLSD